MFLAESYLSNTDFSVLISCKVCYSIDCIKSFIPESFIPFTYSMLLKDFRYVCAEGLYIRSDFLLSLNVRKFIQSSKSATSVLHSDFNPISANPTKWSNTLKQCLSVFGHFVGLALKGLKLASYI